jgi:hypothetical protein
MVICETLVPEVRDLSMVKQELVNRKAFIVIAVKFP